MSDSAHHSHRRRRRRRSSSEKKESLSIDMLRKQRHRKHRARKVRISSARLDLEESESFLGSRDRKAKYIRLIAVGSTLIGITLILNDIGFEVVGKGIGDFISGVGRGAAESIEGKNKTKTGDLVSNELAGLALEPEDEQAPVSGVFRPQGTQPALSKLQLALEANKIGMTEEAFTLLDEAIEIDPDIIGATYLKGIILKENKRYEEAVEVLKQSAEIEGERLFALIELGAIAIHQQDYSGGVQYLTQARKLKNDDPDIRFRLSRALRLNNQRIEGVLEAEAALEMMPGNRQYEINLALAQLSANSYVPEEPETPPTRRSANAGHEEVSPFDLVIEAALAARAGDLTKAEELKRQIRNQIPLLPSLEPLLEDPIFNEKSELAEELPATEMESGLSLAPHS